MDNLTFWGAFFSTVSSSDQAVPLPPERQSTFWVHSFLQYPVVIQLSWLGGITIHDVVSAPILSEPASYVRSFEV